MDLDDALDQLDAIHAHLARAETYPGYRPFALAVSGVAGLAAAVMQPWLVAPDEPLLFARYWLAIAVAGALLAGGVTVLGYFTREDEFARRRTRTVLGQFVPCLFVGAVLSHILMRQEATVVYLPAAWALVYGLGIVASLPYLPRSGFLVAAWFLAWGLYLAAFATGPVPAGWSVGVPFGVGQLIAAMVCRQARQEAHP
jgi:hypothetical protein